MDDYKLATCHKTDKRAREQEDWRQLEGIQKEIKSLIKPPPIHTRRESNLFRLQPNMAEMNAIAEETDEEITEWNRNKTENESNKKKRNGEQQRKEYYISIKPLGRQKKKEEDKQNENVEKNNNKDGGAKEQQKKETNENEGRQARKELERTKKGSTKEESTLKEGKREMQRDKNGNEKDDIEYIKARIK